MSRQVSHVCDGCGVAMQDGSMVSALQVSFYDRTDVSGRTGELQFSWDDAKAAVAEDTTVSPPIAAQPAVPSCGQRAVEALRAAFGKPDLAVTNEGTRNPLLPNGTIIPYYVPAIPTPESSGTIQSPDPGPAAGG